MARPALFGVIAGALGALLGACEDVPTTVDNYYRGSIVWSSYVSVVKKGPVWVQVAGEPFDGPIERTTDVVLAQMEKAMTALPGKFTLYKEEAASEDIRVILVFNGGPFNGERVCQERTLPPGGGPSDKRTHLRAIFCDRTDLLSDAEGYVDDLKGFDDPKFGKLVWHLTRRIIRDNAGR